tara:strand:- start:95 stop:796 length:702 start_codon:yes stop_codon:yes gene_type:complete
MSQNDLVISNQTFPATRADITSALQALGSTSSGPTAPSTTYANMLWYDTTANILKMRAEANDAWISLGYLDQSSDLFKILDDTIVATTAGATAGLLGDQTTATWQDGTGTTESLVSPAKVKAAIEALALSIGASSQTWQTPSRSVNTVYQNNTGRPIMVSYGINNNNFAGETRWTLFTGPTSNPDGEATRASTWNLHNYSGNSSGIVPTDHYYKIQKVIGSNTAGVLYWFELR